MNEPTQQQLPAALQAQLFDAVEGVLDQHALSDEQVLAIMRAIMPQFEVAYFAVLGPQGPTLLSLVCELFEAAPVAGGLVC